MDHPGRQGGMISADFEASKNCIQVPAKPDKANICIEMLNLGDDAKHVGRFFGGRCFFVRDPYKKGALYLQLGRIFHSPTFLVMAYYNPYNPSWLFNRDP